jgi:hypothetical protein
MINDDIKNFPTLVISWHTIDFNALVVTEERIASGTGLPLGDTDGVIVVQEDQTAAWRISHVPPCPVSAMPSGFKVWKWEPVSFICLR